MLSGNEIRQQVYNNRITIEPFCLPQMNPNSYNVRLGDTLMWLDDLVLDLHKQPKLVTVKIPPEGYVLCKHHIYLAATMETIGSNFYVPVIDGRSTIGRYGLAVHITAGFGDVGFHGTFTLELEARHRNTRVYAGDMIAQVSFQEVTGIIETYKGSYQGQDLPRGPKPLGSNK